MELNQVYNLFKSGKKAILLSMLIFVLLVIGVIVVQPLKFGSKSRLLIVQNANSGNDPYAVAKSNDYISSVLSNVVASNSFFNEVLSSGYNIDQKYFSSDIKKQMEKWQKTVEPIALSDAGIIEINVYHPDKTQAEQISLAINYTLKVKSAEYLSMGDKIDLKVIDQPTLSNWPIKPNIPLNFALAIVLGFIFGLSYEYLKLSMKENSVGLVENLKFVKNEKENKNFFSLPRKEKKVIEENFNFDSILVNNVIENNEKEEKTFLEPSCEPLGSKMEQNLAYEEILQNGDMKNIVY